MAWRGVFQDKPLPLPQRILRRSEPSLPKTLKEVSMQAQRLFDTLEELSTCNATPGNGVTRFSWSEADSRARRVLERELKAWGTCTPGLKARPALPPCSPVPTSTPCVTADAMTGHTAWSPRWRRCVPSMMKDTSRNAPSNSSPSRRKRGRISVPHASAVRALRGRSTWRA